MFSGAWVSGYSCIDPSCVGDSWVFQKSKPNTKRLFDELYPLLPTRQSGHLQAAASVKLGDGAEGFPKAAVWDDCVSLPHHQC